MPSVSATPPVKANGRFRLGAISFINTLPLYHAGLKLPPTVDLYTAPPATLNRWMAEGRLDASPVSSAFYLANADAFTVLPKVSVSSFGGVESVLYVENTRSVSAPSPTTIAIPDDSATSVAVLRYLLHRQYGVDPAPRFVTIPADKIIKAIPQHAGGLVIGDRALALCRQAEAQQLPQGLQPYTLRDMATEWVAATETPLVFAVWIIPNTLPLEQQQVAQHVQQALLQAYQRFQGSAHTRQHAVWQAHQHAPLCFTDTQLLNYWQQSLDFGLTQAHRAGLQRLSQAMNGTYLSQHQPARVPAL